MTARAHHPRSRPLPGPVEVEDMPEHIRMLTICALSGAIDVPRGATLPAIYLSAAKALIREAQRIHRDAQARPAWEVALAARFEKEYSR